MKPKNVFHLRCALVCDNLLQSCVNSFMFCSNYTPGLGIGKEIKPPGCVSPMTPLLVGIHLQSLPRNILYVRVGWSYCLSTDRGTNSTFLCECLCWYNYTHAPHINDTMWPPRGMLLSGGTWRCLERTTTSQDMLDVLSWSAPSGVRESLFWWIQWTITPLHPSHTHSL